MQLAHTLAGIAWDPQIRGFLAVGAGVAILIGSIYLLLATNLATRLGFLVAAAAFFGWMAMLSLTWAIYAPGIGPAGDTPHWEVIEANVGDLSQAALAKARELDGVTLPLSDDLKGLPPDEFAAIAAPVEQELAGWKLLAESDAARNEAQAVVDDFLTDPENAEATGFVTTADYLAIYGFETGGKPDRAQDDLWGRITHTVATTLRLKHPTRYAIVQVQATVEQEEVVGERPPTPEADASQPVVSVILRRDLGQRRLPATLWFIGCTIMFGVLCSMLHRRDRRASELRALTPAGG